MPEGFENFFEYASEPKTTPGPAPVLIGMALALPDGEAVPRQCARPALSADGDNESVPATWPGIVVAFWA